MTSLSSRDLEGVGRLQRVLLSPLGTAGKIDPWRHEVNRALIDATGADFALFQLPLEGIPLLYSTDLDPALVRAYLRHMEELDERVDYTDRMARSGVGIRSTLWSGRMRWLYGSAYYNEIVRPARAFDPLWAAVDVPGSRRPAALHVYHGSRSGARFGRRGLAIMRLLRPALDAAVGTLRLARRRREGLLRALDAVPEAIFLVDREGRTLHRNPAAARLREGVPADGELARRVAAAGRDAFGPFHRPGAGTPAVSSRARTRLGVVEIRACLLDADAVGPPAAALVTARPEACEPPDEADLRERLGLTPRQSEVAALLARRATNREIARELGISPSTAERHTEAVMARLGVGSRRRVREKIRPPLPGEAGEEGFGTG